MLKRIFSRNAAPSAQLMGFTIVFLALVVTQTHAVPPALKAAIEEAQLLPTPLPAEDEFMGGSVAIDGTRALVGAEKLSGEGVVYVFEKSGSTWFQSAVLKPDDPRTADRFGDSVALNGDRALVGAYQDSSGGSQAGAAYLFEYNTGSWSESEKFVASDAAANLRFGSSVSISPSGDRLAIGSVPNFGPSDAGAVYIFFESFGNSWVENAKLTASDGATGNQFGGAIALENAQILIGASGDDIEANNAGAAYVFNYSNGLDSWDESQKLVSPSPQASGFFGIAVDLDTDQALIGERGSNSQTGAAYFFAFDGMDWQFEQTLTASDGGTGDYFGASVALQSNTALVGAFSAPSPYTSGSPGAVYAFNKTAGTWSESQKITAVDGNGTDSFGESVALDGTQFITGNTKDDDSGDNAGAGYAYKLDTGSWDLETKLLSRMGPFEDAFGVAVASTEIFTVIGAPENDEAGANAGTAYVFVWENDQWHYQQQLLADDAQATDRFGSSVAIIDDRIIVGAPNRSDSATQPVPHTHFRMNGALWSQSQKLVHPFPSGYDNFGGSRRHRR